MKFLKSDGTETAFTQSISFVNESISPIKEILNHKDFDKYDFVDEEKISLNETSQIQVNINDVGTMIYFFKNVDFDKDSFISDVSKLKEMVVNSFYDVINKIKALFDISSCHNPLFAIYKPAGKWKIFEDCFKSLCPNNINIFYVSTTLNDLTLSNKVTNDSQMQHSIRVGKINISKLVNPLKIIAKDKFQFLFSFISTLLISFTFSVGLYNAYSEKMISTFFFVCTCAGLFLNFMIYKDTFKSNKVKTQFSILTIIFSLFGLSAGVGFYFLFKLLIKEHPVVEPNIALIVGVSLLSSFISSFLPLLIKYVKNKKK